MRLAQKVAASTAITMAGWVRPINTPASAGPTTLVAASATPTRALASASLSGGVIAGIRPPRAGVKKASPVPTTAVSAAISQIGGLATSKVAARTPCAVSRAPSAASITLRLPIRSARTPPPSMNSTCGMTPAAKT